MKSHRAKKKFEKLFLIGVGFLIVIAAVFYFRNQIRNLLSGAFQSLSVPIWRSGDGMDSGLSGVVSWFKSKQSLFEDNRILIERVRELEASLVDREIIQAENSELKEILNRKPAEENLILGAILAKPNKSPYDSLVVDLGAEAGLVVGNRVFAYGDILIGQVSEVYDETSKVELFSTPGYKMEAVLSEVNVFLGMTGRGGGSFEISVPRNMPIEIGQDVFTAGIRPYPLGTIKEIISDERDPIQKALIQSPVNIFELRFVEVEK